MAWQSRTNMDRAVPRELRTSARPRGAHALAREEEEVQRYGRRSNVDRGRHGGLARPR